MAYGFNCALCGYQESEHENQALVEHDTSESLSGYRYSLNDCPGFEYRKEDEAIVVGEYIRDPIVSFPNHLRQIAERRLEDYWKSRGFPDGFPPPTILCGC